MLYILISTRWRWRTKIVEHEGDKDKLMINLSN